MFQILDLPGLKKLGESCGSSRSEICGLCDEGLDCNAPFDACGQCVKNLSTYNLYDNLAMHYFLQHIIDKHNFSIPSINFSRIY